MLEYLKEEANKTLTENGAMAYASTGSECLDLFSAIGALRSASDEEIIGRFILAYADNADLAVKTLFFGRDIREGLGERRVFRVILKWLANHEKRTALKNIPYIAEYGRYDDLLALFGTACEREMLAWLRDLFEADMTALQNGQNVSLLGKWLPSVNASNADVRKMGKKTAHAFGMDDASYRKALSRLRKEIRIIENNLREKDYTFEYGKIPSKALLKYRAAFWRNDEDRYVKYLEYVSEHPEKMHTGTLTPYDIVAPIVKSYGCLSEEERRSLDVTWNAQEDFTYGETALVVADGSGSMYGSGDPWPAAVAQSLAVYFAERNQGAFHNHFMTFSENPQLVEIKGRDISEKIRYCEQFNEVANTDIEKVFRLVLQTAIKNGLPQEELPARLYIISDMEFDNCCDDAEMTNFEKAKAAYEANGYSLPEVVFWNVQSRNRQQPVKKNDQGAVLVSGCSPQVFSMLKDRKLDPWSFMMSVLNSERYQKIVA